MDTEDSAWHLCEAIECPENLPPTCRNPILGRIGLSGGDEVFVGNGVGGFDGKVGLSGDRLLQLWTKWKS